MTFVYCTFSVYNYVYQQPYEYKKYILYAILCCILLDILIQSQPSLLASFTLKKFYRRVITVLNTSYLKLCTQNSR
jgi:hypothetical protein